MTLNDVGGEDQAQLHFSKSRRQFFIQLLSNLFRGKNPPSSSSHAPTWLSHKTFERERKRSTAEEEERSVCFFSFILLSPPRVCGIPVVLSFFDSAINTSKGRIYDLGRGERRDEDGGNDDDDDDDIEDRRYE